MTAAHLIQQSLARFPLAAVALYLVAVAALLFTSWVAVADLFERQAAVESASALLAQLEGRRPSPSSPGGGIVVTAPAGSPFLEGDTVTVAGAALLQRVAGAVTRFGGNVLSSQVDLQGPQSADGYIGLVVSCEIDQPALQQLLYDIESGMPFLFVDQLVAQAPQAAAANVDGSRMRVLLGVSGQWQEEK